MISLGINEMCNKNGRVFNVRLQQACCVKVLLLRGVTSPKLELKVALETSLKLLDALQTRSLQHTCFSMSWIPYEQDQTFKVKDNFNTPPGIICLSTLT